MNLSEDATYWVASTSSIEPPEKLKLNTLNFALGIRANEINENFNLIKYWIDAERLRIGGWGIVEGFDMTKNLSNFTIHVGPGVIINQHGEEIHVKEWVSPPNPPKYVPMTEYHTINEHGVLTLDFAIYSNTWKHTVTYQQPNDTKECDPTEFKITLVDSGKELILDRDIQIIDQNIVVIPSYAGQDVKVEYLYANDRIDGIFLRKDGEEYQYELCIISTSPSNQVVQDYFDAGYYLIGFAYWHVGKTVDVEFFSGDRTYRKVFVDRNNVLYLNGKEYKEKTVIYFIEPQPPAENDLWYNVEDDILYIWRPDTNGEYAWQPVNDLARGITCAYQFPETENPEDLQTLDFNAHPELFFIPGKHQLTIIIDQIVIMEDQYDELYYGQDEINQMLEDDQEKGTERYKQLQKHLCGYGIRLKKPLERPSVIEIRVSHDLNTRRHESDLFQHESLFVASKQYTVTDPSAVIFNTGCEYESGSSQLEVFLNGLRISSGVHYHEIKKDGTPADINGQLCDRFKLLIALSEGDRIEFRVLRPVSSYANLKLIIKEYEDIADHCVVETEQVQQSLEALSSNIDTILSDHTDKIDQHTTAISSLQTKKMDADTIITADQLNEDIRNGIVAGKKKFVFSAGDPVIFLGGLTAKDFLTVGYKPENGDTILLMEDLDYDVIETEDGIHLSVDSRWTGDTMAKFYIFALKIGA